MTDTTETKPTRIEEVDALSYEKTMLQVQLLQMQLQQMQGQLKLIDDQLLAKYGISEGDRINLQDRSITRSEKPAAATAA